MTPRELRPDPARDAPVKALADLITISTVCPACGYPTLGAGLCALCRQPA